jgi:ketosteroid isomerase-like protein
MSRENVEIVRRWVEHYNARQTERLLELCDPDFEFRSVFAALESEGSFRGPAGVAAYFEAVDEVYDDFTLVPQEYHDGGSSVLVEANADWRGHGSHGQGQTPLYAAFWLRAGKVFREETFTDRDAAIEAVGLRE